MVFILDGICAAMFAVYAKVTVDHINEAKTYIAEVNSIPNTLEDVVNIVNSLNEDDTEEDEQ